MDIKTIDITKGDTLRRARLENKLLLREDGTLWTIVRVFTDPEGCVRAVVESTSALCRLANTIESLAKEFKIVESLNLFNNSTYNIDDFASTKYAKENPRTTNKNRNNQKVNKMKDFIKE